MKIHPVVVKPTLLILTALALFMLPGQKLPYLDRTADAYLTEVMTLATTSYGTCRLVNASVSIIKESEIQIEPGALGVSLAAGQILDPLDDLTERASDILITAILALGIQKIVYDLSVAFAPALIAICLISFVIIVRFKGGKGNLIKEYIIKSVVLISVARLCLPTASIVSSYLNDHYFSAEINNAKAELAKGSPEMERFKDIQMPKKDGVMGTVKNGFSFVREKTSDFEAGLKAMICNMGILVFNLLKLSYLYVALFVVQVILLPIGAFWLMRRIANALFNVNIPHIIGHRDISDPIGGKDQTKRA